MDSPICSVSDEAVLYKMIGRASKKKNGEAEGEVSESCIMGTMDHGLQANNLDLIGFPPATKRIRNHTPRTRYYPTNPSKR
jgi:hypothetical protein